MCIGGIRCNLSGPQATGSDRLTCQKKTNMHMMMIEDREVTDGSVLVQMQGCKSMGGGFCVKEMIYVRWYVLLGSVGRRLAAP